MAILQKSSPNRQKKGTQKSALKNLLYITFQEVHL